MERTVATIAEPMNQFTAAAEAGREPYKVKDISLAEFGRNEIRLAEHEMPGLMALRARSEEHTSELQSRRDLVCRLLLEKKKKNMIKTIYITRTRLILCYDQLY